MVWIMAYALSNKMAGAVQKFLTSHPDVVVAQINWQIWFLKNNGDVLAFLSKLKKEDSEHVEFYAIDPLSPDSLPEKIKIVVDYAIKNSCDVTEAVEKLQSKIGNMEDWKLCRIRYERVW
ncbi:MAG: hypothetical protein KKA79_06720 [Nanoarchaeota archaeon]|nr:hypothetical protein [Nanoarchaeota archaeon]MCG2718595.1 hypothetical protein [Nanoarchaeota archaeon]